MPRFPEESVACLKRFMLSRASEDFRFTQNDVDIICVETGLLKPQVQAWAEQFRFYSGLRSLDETLEVLRSNKKVT